MIKEIIVYYECDWCGKLYEHLNVAKDGRVATDVGVVPTSDSKWIQDSFSHKIYCCEGHHKEYKETTEESCQVQKDYVDRKKREAHNRLKKQEKKKKKAENKC